MGAGGKQFVNFSDWLSGPHPQYRQHVRRPQVGGVGQHPVEQAMQAVLKHPAQAALSLSWQAVGALETGGESQLAHAARGVVGQVRQVPVLVPPGPGRGVVGHPNQDSAVRAQDGAEHLEQPDPIGRGEVLHHVKEGDAVEAAALGAGVEKGPDVGGAEVGPEGTAFRNAVPFRPNCF